MGELELNKENKEQHMIVLDHVSKIYPGDFTAIDDLSLTIDEGEFISVVGQSGAGKSTMLKLIYAEERPTTGKVFFDGKSVDSIKRRHLPYYRRDFGTVFQDYKLLPQKTVFENVAYALEVAGETNSEINDKVPKILDIVGLENKMEMYPRQLSGGEQQRVSLARALVHVPKVIIADEPTGNLDPISGWDIIQLLLKINSLGTTILLATHNKDIVDRINKRVIALDRGKIIRDHAQGKYSI